MAADAIPYGATRTYREVAATAGSPRGFRAAGNALGANPLPIVLPCHRVLPSSAGWAATRVDRAQTRPAGDRVLGAPSGACVT